MASRPANCDSPTTSGAGSRRETVPPTKSAVPQSTLDSRASNAATPEGYADAPSGHARCRRQRAGAYAAAMVARREADEAPEEFLQAIASLRAVAPRPEI